MCDRLMLFRNEIFILRAWLMGEVFHSTWHLIHPLMDEYLIVSLIHDANICNDLLNDSSDFDKSSFSRENSFFCYWHRETVWLHKHPLTRALIVRNWIKLRRQKCWLSPYPASIMLNAAIKRFINYHRTRRSVGWNWRKCSLNFNRINI